MYCQPFYHHQNHHHHLHHHQRPDFSLEKQQVNSISPGESTVQLTSALHHQTLSPPPSPCHNSTHFNSEQLVYHKEHHHQPQQQQLSTGDVTIRLDTPDHHSNQRWASQAEMSTFTWPTPQYGSYSHRICNESNESVVIAPSTGQPNVTASINGTEDISDADSSDLASFSSHFRDRLVRNFNDSPKQLDSGYTYSSVANQSVATPNINNLNNNNKSSLFCLMSQSMEDDEDARRKRRRERNKLAASKCRFKKRQHVAFLMSESERLESSNSTLKVTLNELQSELEQLAQVLHSHKCHFVKQNILQLSNIITPFTHQA